jgi:ribosomal protein L37AE/L43A
MAPFHCPYCGEEDLRPTSASAGTWSCACCARSFQLRFLGMGSIGGPE